MTIRSYLRRSKNDEGKQQFSLDVQREGCREFLAAQRFGTHSLIEYVDDGKSGDDFHSRAGLRKLMAEAQPGDVVVCRDQSRLGRDAIEVTLVIRDLVRDRGCRLYYYTTGQEVQFSNAIDQATTFIQGTGHQMELEAIRSRTREALRARVREGRIAGGRCYGYRLERRADPSGRSYTIAIVDPQQAEIVRRIFREYREGRGLKLIAHALNAEGVPAPMAGRRGTGSWAPGAIRVMLLNSRYRGLYVHGKVKRVRRGNGLERVKADPSEILSIEIPEWQIIDEDTWDAVQARFAARTGTLRGKRVTRSVAKYALTGLARCGTCGGPIGVARSRHGKERFLSYGCSWHHQRGASVCPVTVYQRTEEVEGALIEVLQREILTPSTLDMVLSVVREEIAVQMPKAMESVAALEAEIETTRAEQKKLARAVAMADDIPELVAELQQRSARLRSLEAQLLAARRTPDEVAALMGRVEQAVQDKLDRLRDGLNRPEDMRQVFLAMFPEGIRLEPTRVGKRQVWQINCRPNLGELGAVGFKLGCDPDGNRTRVFGVRGRRPRPLDDGAMCVCERFVVSPLPAHRSEPRF